MATDGVFRSLPNMAQIPKEMCHKVIPLMERLEEVLAVEPLDAVIPSLDAELPNFIALQPELARRGVLDLSKVVSRTIPLDAAAINGALDELEHFTAGVRTVIVP